MAGATSEIYDTPGVLGVDAREQLEKGPGAVVVEGQILLRIPH